MKGFNAVIDISLYSRRDISRVVINQFLSMEEGFRITYPELVNEVRSQEGSMLLPDSYSIKMTLDAYVDRGVLARALSKDDRGVSVWDYTILETGHVWHPSREIEMPKDLLKKYKKSV